MTRSVLALAFLLSACMGGPGRVESGGTATADTSTDSGGSGTVADSTVDEPPPAEVAEPFPPGEWTLAERSIWEQIYEDRGQQLGLMNSTCGTEISMSFDHEAFRDRLPAVEANRNEDWSASAMLMEIRNLCLEGDAEKQAVAGAIERVLFVRAPATHALADGTLTVALDLDANPREHVNGFAEWLPTAL